MDVDTRETFTLGGTDLTIAVANITFTARENHHYEVTVEATNIAGSATSEATISE
jgi:hypothetical protein